MEIILKTLIMEILPVVIVAVILVALPPVRKFLKAVFDKIRGMVGDSVYNEIKNFAMDAIKSLMQQYPESTVEDIVSKTLVQLESKFGTIYFTADEFKIIIRSVIQDLQLNTGEILNIIDNSAITGAKNAEQLYISGKIKSEDRKEVALNVVNKSLFHAKVEITDNLKSIVDSKVEDKVYDLKNNDEKFEEEKKVLKDEIDKLTAQINSITSEKDKVIADKTNVVNENNQLKNQLANIKNAYQNIAKEEASVIQSTQVVTPTENNSASVQK